MTQPDPTESVRLPLAVTDAIDFVAAAASRRWEQTPNRYAYVHVEIHRAARAAAEAVWPIASAAGRAAAAADIREAPYPDPSPCLPAWHAGYTEATETAARVAEESA